MFTGIVEEKGKVIQKRDNFLKIQAKLILEDTKIGESILVNGVCLTVVEIDNYSFKVEVMPETLKITNLSYLNPHQSLNLERALQVSSRLGGHLVTGHIDATSRLIRKKNMGNSTLMEFELSQAVSKYIIKKGSVAIDGMSLTVADLSKDTFIVSLIPHTLRVTNLGEISVGYLANIETDLIGKYLEKLISQDNQEKINLSTLERSGFL
ncbi:riboflavin synthase [bacterium]|nr:riboflavin synthase [bacterium]MBU2599162.1 riboflavin synthase [bacterium]